MKEKRFLVMMVVLAMVLMCMSGLTVFAENETFNEATVNFETVWDYGISFNKCYNSTGCFRY